MHAETEITEVPPPFCTSCGRDGPADAALCPECGEGLVPKGYCPVCDEYLRVPEGSQCPKHDLVLTAGRPPAKPALRDGEDIDWVTVGACATTNEAEARRLRLEAEGIPTFLDGLRMGSHAIYSVATGGIKIQVPSALAADARVILSQSWAAPESPDDLEEAWDDLEPRRGLDFPPFMGIAVGVFCVILVAMLAYLIYG